MPSFDNVRTKHLTIVKSEKVPVKDIPTSSKKIEADHSGTTYRVGGIATPVTLTLPSAKKGRVYSFLVSAINSSPVTISPKSGDVIYGNMLADQGIFSTTASGSLAIGLYSFTYDTTGVGTVTVSATGTVTIPSIPTGTLAVPATNVTVAILQTETVALPVLFTSSSSTVSASLSVSGTQNALYNIAHSSSAPVVIGTGAGIGSKIDFICLANGIWYLTGVGNGTIASNATISTAVFA